MLAAFRRQGGRLRHAGLVHHIELDHAGVDTGTLQGSRSAFATLGVATPQPNAMALRAQLTGDRESDALAGSGDERLTAMVDGHAISSQSCPTPHILRFSYSLIIGP